MIKDEQPKEQSAAQEAEADTSAEQEIPAEESPPAEPQRSSELPQPSPELASEGIERMTEMIKYITTTLAREPDTISLAEDVTDDQVIFNLTVGSEDKGRIIGKEGRTAQAIRSLLRVAGVKYGVRTRLEIL